MFNFKAVCLYARQPSRHSSKRDTCTNTKAEMQYLLARVVIGIWTIIVMAKLGMAGNVIGTVCKIA